MIKIVPYSPEHLLNLKSRACHEGERVGEVRTDAVTFLLGETPIAIIGWYFINEGVMQVWALLTDLVTTRPLAVTKSTKLLIDYAFETHSLRRMQLSVKVGYMAGWKWAEFLGFSCEGIMKNYGPNSDYWLFARTT